MGGKCSFATGRKPVNETWNACHIHCVCVGNTFFFCAMNVQKPTTTENSFFFMSKHMNTQISNTQIYYPFVRWNVWSENKMWIAVKYLWDPHRSVFCVLFHSPVEMMQKHLPNNNNTTTINKVYPTNEIHFKHLIFVKSKEISMRIFARCYKHSLSVAVYELNHINFFRCFARIHLTNSIAIALVFCLQFEFYFRCAKYLVYSVYFMLKINENKIIKINRALNFSTIHTHTYTQFKVLSFVQPLCHFALPSRQSDAKIHKMNTIKNELENECTKKSANESTDIRKMC